MKFKVPILVMHFFSVSNNFFHSSNDAEVTKVSITVISEANHWSRVAAKHTCTFQFWPGYVCTDAILDPEHHYNKAHLSKGPMKNHIHKNNGTMEQ